MPEVNNGWNEWSRYVLKAIEDANTTDEKILVELRCLKTEISQLSTEIALIKERASWRAGFWGVIGGAIPVAIAVIAQITGIL